MPLINTRLDADAHTDYIPQLQDGVQSIARYHSVQKSLELGQVLMTCLRYPLGS